MKNSKATFRDAQILRQARAARRRAEADQTQDQTTSRDDPTGTTAEIAQRILKIETLETRNSDALDFHELAVWTIRAALDAAYEAGRQSAAR